MAERIIVDGVTFDLVVQRDGPDWIVAEADGSVIYSRHASRATACAAMQSRAEALRAAPEVA